MPLLWVLRDVLSLPGTKYGCGISVCGACTVLVDGEAVRFSVMPASAAADRKVVTIEGLAADGVHRIQQAWIQHEVPQCGYCHTGMIMSEAALLAKNPKPADADIDAAMTNLCRCGTYGRVRMAIHALAEGQATARKPCGARDDEPIARSEMGQVTLTALSQLVAEELDCDWGKVSTEFASPNEHIRRNRARGSMSTGGSQGVRSSQDYLRKASASARRRGFAVDARSCARSPACRG